jgi:hypothetical protein
MLERTGRASILLHHESLLPFIGGGSSCIWTCRLFDFCVGVDWWVGDGSAIRWCVADGAVVGGIRGLVMAGW